jgi:hypothetical protein
VTDTEFTLCIFFITGTLAWLFLFNGFSHKVS